MLTAFASITLVRDPNNNYLLTSRRSKPDDLGFPGGKVDHGESSSDAALRELREETGVVGTNPRLVYSEVDPISNKLVHVFEVDVDPAHVLNPEKDIKVVWADIKLTTLSTSTFREFNSRLIKALGL